MKEATRQFYLQAMGVTLWYPRQVLPGAAPSPELDFSEAETVLAPPAAAAVADVPVAAAIAPSAQPTESRGRPSKDMPVARAPDLSGLMRESANTPPSAPQKAPVTPPPEARPAAVSALESVSPITIYCGLWVGERYAVLADLDPQVSLELQQTLIRNLLQAVGGDRSDSAHPIRFQQVRWPVFANPLIPGNGADGLKAVLGRLLPADDQHDWIVLGEESSRVIDAGIARPQSLWLRESFRPADMAADSQLKRRLWLRIQEQQGAVS